MKERDGKRKIVRMMIMTQSLQREMTGKVRAAPWELAGMCHSEKKADPYRNHKHTHKHTHRVYITKSCHLTCGLT